MENNQLPKVLLAQPIALMIERCRSYGISDSEMIQNFRTKDFSKLPQSDEDPIDYAKWLAVAEENGNDWEKAILSGYSFSFISINGIRKLLAAKYGKVADRDYSEVGDSIQRLHLNAADVKSLRSLVSKQWEINVDQNDTNEGELAVTIELKYE